MGTAISDWTYEKSWQEPEEIKIDYVALINPDKPSQGTEERSATFTDEQWSETWTKYNTFAYQNPDNTYDVNDYVIYRLRRTHTTAAAICPNYFKALLEAGERVTNVKVFRDEETELFYEKSQEEGGWRVSSELTTTYVKEIELIGALPIEEWQGFVEDPSLTQDLYDFMIASTVDKQYFVHSINKGNRYASYGKLRATQNYYKTTTITRSALGFTQEGQQYFEDILKEETAQDRDAPGAQVYTITRSALKAAKKLQADGVQVNSGFGRVMMEEKPNDYDEAEEDLDEDDIEPDDEGEAADTSTSGDPNNDGGGDSSGSGGSGGGNTGSGGNTGGGTVSSVDLVGNDLLTLWESWSPYGDSGTGILQKDSVWSGDPATATDKKPLYYLTTGSDPGSKGEFDVNTLSPRNITRFKISSISEDNYVTNPFKVGERIFLNNKSGSCSWWYLIRSVSTDGKVATVKYIEDILRPVYADYLCERLAERFPYRILVTGVNDSSDKVFTLPYAPDDFMVCLDGDFHVVPGNAQEAAARYVAVQLRLLDGQTKGINVTTSLKELPSKPFADVYLNMLGTSIYGRMNGTTWAFNESGCVVSADIIYGGHAGRDGTEAGRRQRQRILERNAACPVGQTEGWINPPDGLTNNDLPEVVATANPEESVRKANSIDVDPEFDLDDLPCNFWQEVLPVTDYNEIAAEEITTDHVFATQSIPNLVGATRTRATVKGFDGTIFLEPEQITLVTRTLAENEYVDTTYYPKPLVTRTMTYAQVQGWNPDEGGGGGPEPPDPEQPTIDCTLRVKTGFGPVN